MFTVCYWLPDDVILNTTFPARYRSGKRDTKRKDTVLRGGQNKVNKSCYKWRGQSRRLEKDILKNWRLGNEKKVMQYNEKYRYW